MYGLGDIFTIFVARSIEQQSGHQGMASEEKPVRIIHFQILKARIYRLFILEG